MLTKEEAYNYYQNLKQGRIKYNEEEHCPLMLEIMADGKKGGQLSAVAAAIGMSSDTLRLWMKKNPLFAACYEFGKDLARQAWEREGVEIRDLVYPPGTTNNRFEHWRLMGWSRFGISKNSRIRLDLDPKAAPNEHYSQLLEQAGKGDFTAGEIKQLMEAVNVGMNAHQTFQMQKEIDQLKFDFGVMTENTNADNRFADKGITQKD